MCTVYGYSQQKAIRILFNVYVRVDSFAILTHASRSLSPTKARAIGWASVKLPHKGGAW